MPGPAQAGGGRQPSIGPGRARCAPNLSNRPLEPHLRERLLERPVVVGVRRRVRRLQHLDLVQERVAVVHEGEHVVVEDHLGLVGDRVAADRRRVLLVDGRPDRRPGIAGELLEQDLHRLLGILDHELKRFDLRLHPADGRLGVVLDEVLAHQGEVRIGLTPRRPGGDVFRMARFDHSPRVRLPHGGTALELAGLQVARDDLDGRETARRGS